MGMRRDKQGSSDSGSKASPEGKGEKVKGFDVDAKIKKVEESKMPDDQKTKLIRKLKTDSAEKGDLISFAVYCQRKKVKLSLRDPMKSYPSAKGVRSATFEGWEEIYKNF